MSGEGPEADFAVAFRSLMVDVLAQEIGVTARVLARIPEHRRDYRPDPKSRSAWELAWHAAADVWFLEGIANLRFEPNPDQTHANPCSSGPALAEWYEARAAEALQRIRSMPVELLRSPVVLGGVAEQSGQAHPAFLYLLFAHTHMVHHRGELVVYLRPMGAQVPSIYGPSADEPIEGKQGGGAVQQGDEADKA
jgi:uncharacterized damage-inducible protein DinB